MPTGKLSVEGRAGAYSGEQVLRVVGTITLETVSVFQSAAQATESPSLIIDLTEVPYIDSAALGAFVQTYVSCQRAGRRLALAGLSHRVRGLLQITSLDHIFNTFATAAEAEKALA